MFRPIQFVAAILILFALVPSHASPPDYDRLVVYVKCTSGLKDTEGSGVIVDPTGLVLTADHVVPDDGTCMGAIGDKSAHQRELVVVQDIAVPYGVDARFLRFRPSEDEMFPHATFCEIDENHKSLPIIVTAFHPQGNDEPSTTNGIISTVRPNKSNQIETSAMSVQGKSGGPAFFKDTTTIIGIVAGAAYNSSGTIPYYGVLATNVLDTALEAMEEASTCARPKQPRTAKCEGAAVDLPGWSDGQITFKVLLDEFKYAQDVNVDPTLFEALNFNLQINIDNTKFGNEYIVAIPCAGRRPGSLADIAPEAATLAGLNAVVETFGVFDGDELYLGNVILPLLDGSDVLKAATGARPLYSQIFPYDTKKTHRQFLKDLLLYKPHFPAFVSVGIGSRSFDTGEFDLARKYFCRAGALLGEVLEAKKPEEQIAKLEEPITQLKEFAENMAIETIAVANKARNGSGPGAVYQGILGTAELPEGTSCPT